MNVKVVFQVRVHPQRFDTGPQTIGKEDPIDFPLDNEEIEWSTTARDAIIPVALLILVEDSPGLYYLGSGLIGWCSPRVSYWSE